ncbi:hypothetical protein BHE74_00052516, partial [Ensete ventricosum]
MHHRHPRFADTPSPTDRPHPSLPAPARGDEASPHAGRKIEAVHIVRTTRYQYILVPTLSVHRYTP